MKKKKKIKNKKIKRTNVLGYENVNKLLKERKILLNAFECKVNPMINQNQGTWVKLSTTKQILQKLLIAPA